MAPIAVLFDLDGTLIDTMQTFADVAADVMVEVHGAHRATVRAAYLETSGIPFFRQLELIMPGDPRNREAAAAFERRKVRAIADVTPSEITLVALRRLRQRGIRIGVCSNNFQDQVDRFVDDCPAPFELALGFGPGLAKGGPHFDRACSEFNCSREDLVFVGDSLADAEIARAEGVRFVGRLGTFDASAFYAASPASPVVQEIDELLALFA